MSTNIINTTANTANTNTVNNMTSEERKMFFYCNMLYKGKGFCVVRKPDYMGGHYHDVEAYSYEPKDFETIEWCGTPMEYVAEKPTFVTHIEPIHGEPKDYPHDALEFVEWEVKNRMK